MNLKELAPYVDKLTSLSLSKIISIGKSYGIAGIQVLVGLHYDDDQGGTVMTQKELIRRREKCDGGCPLQTSQGWCNPGMSRAHVSEKNQDGTPLVVTGCACKLPVKQRDINEHCPAGEW
jgi:hypothetical protein